MSDEQQPPRCFRCGGPANELNEIEEGVNCPACAERLIESVQGVFHEPWDRQGFTPSEEERPHAEAELVEREQPPRARGGAPRPLPPTDDHGPRRA
ncbi:MAG: hypothetical protein R3F49_11995 [Planctomycetota bacterium]